MSIDLTTGGDHWAEYLKAHRLARGFRASRVALRCGITNYMYNQYEQGRIPDPAIVERIASSYDADPDDFRIAAGYAPLRYPLQKLLEAAKLLRGKDILDHGLLLQIDRLSSLDPDHQIEVSGVLKKYVDVHGS